MENCEKIKVGLSNINISFGGQSYFPYSIGLMLAYALEHVPNAKSIFDFGSPLFKKIPVERGVAHLIDSELVFFSISLWNAELSKEIARKLKSENPNVTIVFGGCSVPPESRVEKFLVERPYVDVACHGEGEKIFSAILEGYARERRNTDWSKIPSISFRRDGTVVSTQRAPRLKDIGQIPSPYLTGLFDKLIKENPQDGWIGLWETNRGCPYSCAYCEWGGEVGKGVSWNDMDRLMKEIDWFSMNKTEFVRCADANFGIKPQRDLALVQKLVENNCKYGYPQAVSVENAKNSNKSTFEIQKLLNDSGLSQGVNLAIQSMHDPSLVAIKRKNISNELYAELQHMFEEAGIATFTDMIIGLPEETYDTFVNGVARLIENGQNNSISYYNALILPNSEMGDPAYQKKYGILTTTIRQICNHEQLGEDTIHEVEEIVIGTNTLSTDDWRRVKAFAWESSLLYHRKLLQIPLTIAFQSYGIGYRRLFEAFCEVDRRTFPILGEINDFFRDKARMIQEMGSPNHVDSERWLRMWWPADQFKLIDLVSSGKLDAFYVESTHLINQIIGETKEAISDAILLNKEMLKRPFQKGNLTIDLDHNVFEVYRGNVVGKSIELVRGKFQYSIDRSSETWQSWDDWAKKVVWWKHKKSEYLYRVQPVEYKGGFKPEVQQRDEASEVAT